MTQKVALITGASAGVGLGTARVFDEHGWVVYSLSRTPPPDDAIIHFPFDLAQPLGLKAILSDLLQIDALIHNAGVTGNGPEVTALGVPALSALLHATRDRLMESRGALVVVSSYAAGRPEYGLYGKVKADLEDFTLRFAQGAAPFGVRANIVRPHYITGTRNWPVAQPATAATIPLGHFGQPRDCGTLIYELAVNPFVTGAVVPVDGGVSVSERTFP